MYRADICVACQAAGVPLHPPWFVPGDGGLALPAPPLPAGNPPPQPPPPSGLVGAVGGGGGEGGGAEQLQRRVETLEDAVETLRQYTATLQRAADVLGDGLEDVRQQCRRLDDLIDTFDRVPWRGATAAD